MPRKKGSFGTPYKKKPIEERGKAGTEPAVYNNFWGKYSMDYISELSDQELDELIDKFLDNYIDKAKKRDPQWNFPDRVIAKIVKKKKNNSKYKADDFNRRYGKLDKGNPFII